MRDATVTGDGPFTTADYFAFVESVERFDPTVFADWPESPALEPGEWRRAMARRGQLDLAPPTAVAVLDCVSAPYFVSLPWRDEVCRIGDAVAAQRRRAQIAELDPSAFMAVIAFLDASRDDEGALLASFAEGAWLFVALAEEDTGLPVLSQGDFDFDPERDSVRHIAEHGQLDEPLGRSLVRVFNLDFLSDAHFRDESGPPETPPISRPPWDFGGTTVQWTQVERPLEL